jgi:hypothetical protein
MTDIRSLKDATGNVFKPRTDVHAVDGIDEYIDGKLPSVPVTSVNGKTGAVELTAADVGADTPTGVHVFWLSTAGIAGADAPVDAKENDVVFDSAKNVWRINTELKLALVGTLI